MGTDTLQQTVKDILAGREITTVDKEALFLDWVNQFVSSKGFASWYGITDKEALFIIKRVRAGR